jgi:hypothetical protein
VTPKIRKFRQSWGSKRYAIQHETENHATLLTGIGDFVKIPKIGAIHKKTLPRSSPSHGTFTKEEEWHRNANLSPCPKKSNQCPQAKTQTKDTINAPTLHSIVFYFVYGNLCNLVLSGGILI